MGIVLGNIGNGYLSCAKASLVVMKFKHANANEAHSRFTSGSRMQRELRPRKPVIKSAILANKRKRYLLWLSQDHSLFLCAAAFGCICGIALLASGIVRTEMSMELNLMTLGTLALLLVTIRQFRRGRTFALQTPPCIARAAGVMQFPVLRRRQDLQITVGAVSWVFVFMVDMFTRLQWASESLFNYGAIFQHCTFAGNIHRGASLRCSWFASRSGNLQPEGVTIRMFIPICLTCIRHLRTLFIRFRLAFEMIPMITPVNAELDQAIAHRVTPAAKFGSEAIKIARFISGSQPIGIVQSFIHIYASLMLNYSTEVI